MRVELIEDAIRRRTRGKNWPKLTDFEQDVVFLASRMANDLLYGLRLKRHAILIGSEGRGKSTAAEVVGFRQYQAGDRVYFIDCGYESSQTTDQIGTTIVNRDAYGPLWIIDDIQDDPDGMASLYEFIESTSRSRFLFVWRRKVPPDLREIATDEDWLDEVLEKSTVVAMIPTEETVREIVTSYVGGHRQEQRFADDTFLGTITPEYLTQVLAKTGGNLRTLTRYLQIWDPRTQPLNTVEPEAILDFTKEDRLKPLLEAGDDLLQTYVDIAASYQFDVPVSADVGTPGTISELEQQGLIVSYGAAFYGLAHSSDARDVIKAFANMTGKTPGAVTEASFSKHLQLTNVPLSHSLRLMKAVRDASWYSPSHDVRDRFSDWAANHGVIVKTHYIRSFCKNPSDLTKFIERIGGKKFIRDVGIHTSMPKLREFFAAVRHIDARLADELESALSIDDKVAMYSRTKFSSLAKSLGYYAQDERSRHFANRILAEVINTDLAARIQRTSIRACGRFLWGATQVDNVKAGIIAETVAQHVSLSTADNAEELSLLIRNLGVNESARVSFIERVVNECEPETLIAEGKPDGYSFLLTAIGNHYAESGPTPKALKFFSFFTTAFPDEKMQALSDQSLAALIWNVWRMDERIEPLLRRISNNILARLRRAEADNLFWLMWSLLQASERVYRQSISDVKHDIEQRLNEMSLGASKLAVIGLLTYTATPVVIPVSGFSSDDIATELLRRPQASRILFALLGAKRAGEEIYKTIRSEIEQRGIDPGKFINELISRNNIEATQAHLRKIANQLELRESEPEPES